MNEFDEVSLVVTSVRSAEEANSLAQTLIRERLAACVTVLRGAVSFYEWQGALTEAEEAVILIKTTKAQAPSLEKRIKELHPYDVPEVLRFEAQYAEPAFSAWIRATTSGSTVQN